MSVPTGSNTGAYVVSWTAVSAATSYQLEERVNGGAWAQIHNAAATSKVVSGKAPGTYEYRVRACNAAGCGNYSAIKAITLVTPAIPAGLYLEQTSSACGVGWGASTGASSYELRGSGTTIYSGPNTGFSQTSPRTCLAWYAVRACNGVGCSGWSAPVSPSGPTDPPLQVAPLQWLAGLVLGGCGLLAQAQTTVEYIHTDGLGSVVAVTNQAGQVIERLDYEPYGAIIGQPNYGGIGFTGHVQDAATGLTYMQQRYYDPTIGRFLSVDPVAVSSGIGANFNRYWYANNNPYKFKDPDGRFACSGNESGCRQRIEELERRGIPSWQAGGGGSGGSGRRTRDWDPSKGRGSDRVDTSDGPRVWLSPTGKGVRGCDGYGCGHDGASRGRRTHQGADYVATAGQAVGAPTNGLIERRSNPYAGDARYTGLQLKTDEGHTIKLWYVTPDNGIVGSEVRTGQRLGVSQDLSIKYPGNMTNHVHERITDSQGDNIDPASITR
ncbi:RHS repeat-associated core domain-containing protein [Pseudoxanthomonas sp. UTMC 1351]|uniref:RHS repeat-associated core domain-containing protein n=1 Tax=Pseudoxanthomonas sp. UTMC 1351 TaxID=2695853 RepID=UPI0034CFBD2D